MGAYHRSSKSVDFIALNDGSTIKNVQVVVDPSKFDESMLKQITTAHASMSTANWLRAGSRTDGRAAVP